MVPENLEAERLESVAEKFRVVSKLAELRRADVGAVLAGDDAEGRENLRAHGGGHGHGVGAPRGVLSDARHRLVVAGDVPPGGSERFREGAHHDVDVGGVDAELLAHAATGGTDGADGVRLIEPDVRAVHLAHPDDVRKATQLALHAVDALDDDQNLVVSRTLAGDGVLEDELQVPDAVVLEGADFRAGETRALDDGVVVERVRNDEVAGAADGGDDGGVGGETHTHHHGSLLAHESRRGLLHLLHRGAVPELRAGSAAGDGVIADRLHDERRAVGVQTAETEVIVRAEVQASSRLRRGDELTEEPALGLGRADGDVDPILGGGVHGPVEDVLDVAVQVPDVEEIFQLALGQRRKVVALPVGVVRAPVLDAAERVEGVLRDTLGHLRAWESERRGRRVSHGAGMEKITFR